jgi:hypothetical protein
MRDFFAFEIGSRAISPPTLVFPKALEAIRRERVADLKVRQANVRAKNGGIGRPRRFS